MQTVQTDSRHRLGGLWKFFASPALALATLSCSPTAFDVQVSDDIKELCGPDVRLGSSNMNSSDAAFSGYDQLDAELAKISEESPVVLIGDTNHSDKEINSFLSSSLLLAKLNKAGVKHIYLELPTKYQDEIDQIANNVDVKNALIEKLASSYFYYSGENGLRVARQQVNFILDAQDLGIEVHFVDSKDNQDKAKTQASVDYRMAKRDAHMQMCPNAMNMSKQFTSYFNRVNPELYQASRASRRYSSSTRNDDTVNLPLIGDAFNEPSVFIYGAKHYDENNPGSYYNLLGDKVASVVLMNNTPGKTARELSNMNSEAVSYMVPTGNVTFHFATNDRSAPSPDDF